MAKWLGDITQVEEFTSKTGEPRKKFTKVGALLENEKGHFTVSMFGSYLPVFANKKGEKSDEDDSGDDDETSQKKK